MKFMNPAPKTHHNAIIFQAKDVLKPGLSKKYMPTLSRAQSWPLLQPAGPMPGTQRPAEKKNKECRAPTPAAIHLTAQAIARRLLCRHYYPEGGWGWTIVVCATLAQLLAHGLQLSYGVMVHSAQRKYVITPMQASGKDFFFQITP